jgi:hypothetical protein
MDAEDGWHNAIAEAEVAGIGRHLAASSRGLPHMCLIVAPTGGDQQGRWSFETAERKEFPVTGQSCYSR